MASEPLSRDESDSEVDPDGEGLSQNGQMIGIAVFGGLLLVLTAVYRLKVRGAFRGPKVSADAVPA